MKKKLARILSNAFCAFGLYFSFFFLYFVAVKPLNSMPPLASVLMAVVGGAVAWKLDDLREG